MKINKGKVLKTSNKTAIVQTERLYVHPKYKKQIKKTSTIMVDDSLGVQVGDLVTFVQCAPISKRKRHSIKEKV